MWSCIWSWSCWFSSSRGWPSIGFYWLPVERGHGERILPSFNHVAVSSANRLATVSTWRSTSMSLMLTRKRRGEIDDPCGNPSFRKKELLRLPLTSTHVFLVAGGHRPQIYAGHRVWSSYGLVRRAIPCRMPFHSHRKWQSDVCCQESGFDLKLLYKF